MWSENDYNQQWIRVLASLNWSFRSLEHPQLLRLVQFIRNAPPTWEPKIPSPRLAGSLITKQVRSNIDTMVKKIPPYAKVSVACDCWTSPNHIAFLAITM